MLIIFFHCSHMFMVVKFISGTHCAGIVGGSTHGVSKNVFLVAVKALNKERVGSVSSVIAALDWITQEKMNNPSRRVIASMSLGGPSSGILDSSVNAAVNKGVIVVVSAGNDSKNACESSPARATGAITVAATTSKDQRASYSNFGPCVDIFAPGSSISSTWIGPGTSTEVLDGTSMAAPFVAGVIALYLEAGFTVDEMLQDATHDLITDIPDGTPNRLVFSGNVQCINEIVQPVPPVQNPKKTKAKSPKQNGIKKAKVRA